MKKKIEGLCNIIGVLLLLSMIVVCIPMTVPRFFGYQIYQVETGSMEPEYPAGALVYVKSQAPEKIQKNDVVTFQLGTDTNYVETHRVVEIDKENKQFTTKGDANEAVDPEKVAFSSLIGRVEFCVPHIGKAAVWVQSRKGIIGLGTLFFASALLFFLSSVLKSETMKITGTLGILIGIGIMGFAIWKIYGILQIYQQGEQEYTSLQKMYVSQMTDDSSEEGDEEQEKWEQFRIDFDALEQVNPEVVGWLAFDELELSYPLVQTTDDAKYLKTTFQGEENACGAIFLEAAVKSDLSEPYSIIYGHNMKDLSMFGKLRYYKTEEGFYQNNRYFTIYTREKAMRYEIFSYADVDQTSEVYTVGFKADDVFREFLEKRQEESYEDTGVEVTEQDHVVVLSTCSTEGKRFVVLGKKIKEIDH